jgi:hypothetical protein
MLGVLFLGNFVCVVPAFFVSIMVYDMIW